MWISFHIFYLMMRYILIGLFIFNVLLLSALGAAVMYIWAAGCESVLSRAL